MRIMVVDDSIVFRSQLKNCLDRVDGFSVVSTAANGKIALERLESDACDLIILDMEMPEMNGLQFLEVFKKRGYKQKIIVFASPTLSGGNQVLQALHAGASDFIAKPSGTHSLEEALAGIQKELLPKIKQFQKNDSAWSSSKDDITHMSLGSSGSNRTSLFSKIDLDFHRPEIVIIASSTGGPAALEKMFSYLKGKNLRIPVIIAQHMPPHFTEALARRLSTVSGQTSSEGTQGQRLQGGHIYVAPGDYHLTLKKSESQQETLICINQLPKRHNVRPAADYLFESTAEIFGRRVLGFVLTGMGEDGKEGALAVKRKDGGIMIQDRNSSVVWGMPGAVHQAQAYDREGSITECGELLAKLAC